LVDFLGQPVDFLFSQCGYICRFVMKTSVVLFEATDRSFYFRSFLEKGTKNIFSYDVSLISIVLFLFFCYLFFKSQPDKKF